MALDDQISGYAAGIFEIAKAEGAEDRVRTELQQIARTFESSNELRETLSDPRLPSDRKQSILDDLLGSRASELSVGIVGLVVGLGMATSLPAIADALSDEAAAAQNREVAEIRTAVDLGDETVARLVAALEKVTGKELAPNVVVDASVMGGIVARVGDQIIDGSIQKRLTGMRQALTAR
jgi:F-type H+-transporting ATPase subunit delta